MMKYNDSDTIKRSSGIHPQLFSLKSFLAGKCFLEVTFKDTLRKKYPYSVLFLSAFSEYGRFSRGEISCPFLGNAPIYSNALQTFTDSKAVPRRYSVKTVFLKLSQNSQKYTCARVSF